MYFAAKKLGRTPSDLHIDDLDEDFLGSFLNHLEDERKNSIRTRNTRLAALHAFFRYVALSEPAYALNCQRVLAIPTKRYLRTPVEFLTDVEVEALVAAPDPAAGGHPAGGRRGGAIQKARNKYGGCHVGRRAAAHADFPPHRTLLRVNVVLVQMPEPLAHKRAQPQEEWNAGPLHVLLQPLDSFQVYFLQDVRGIDAGPHPMVETQLDHRAKAAPVPREKVGK